MIWLISMEVDAVWRPVGGSSWLRGRAFTRGMKRRNERRRVALIAKGPWRGSRFLPSKHDARGGGRSSTARAATGQGKGEGLTCGPDGYFN
jgi:hypothetical protein